MIAMQNKQMTICENISGPPVDPTDCNLAVPTSPLQPTCTAWRSWCRFQEPPATTILNPQQKTLSLMEPAIMMIYKWLPCNHNHPSQVLLGSYSRFMAKLFLQSLVNGTLHQPVLPLVHAWYPQSTGLLGAESIWCKARLEQHACLSSKWHSGNTHIQIQLRGGAPDF